MTVQVVGSQGQGLNAAKIEIKNSAGIIIFTGLANVQGVTSIIVPYGTYNVGVDYKGFTNTASVIVSSPAGTVQTIATNVFIEILQPMTFVTFILYLAIILTIAVGLPFVIIRQRKKSKLPPPPS